MSTFSAAELNEDFNKNETRSGGAPTFFDSLKKKLNQPPKLKTHDYVRVPGRDFALKVSADLDATKLEGLRNKYTNKKGKLDTVAWFCSLIASQTEVFVTDDDKHDEVRDEYGEPVNFFHKDVQESVNAIETAGTVKSIFGRDSNILNAGDEVLTITGYAGQTADDSDDDDPFDSEND